MALKTINGIAVASIKTTNGVAAASVKTWGGETWTHFTPTTWNPSDKGVDITLSGSNLIATNNGTANGDPGCRSIASQSTGKFYFEVVPNPGGGQAIGFANSTWAFANFGDANFLGYRLSNGQINQATTLATVETGSAGARVCVAVDLGANLLWIKVNAGNWNNNASYDPATATGGVTFTNMGTVFAACYVGTFANQATTANLGASAFTYSVPSGFTAGFG